MDRFALSLRFAALALAASLAVPALAHEETHHHHDHSHDDGRGDWARNYITVGFAEGSDDCSIEHNYGAVHQEEYRSLFRYGSRESFCPEHSFAASFGHRFHRNWGLEIGQIRGPEVETEGDDDDGYHRRYPNGFRYFPPHRSRPLPYNAKSEAVTSYAAVTFFLGSGTGFQPYLMAGKARREFTLSHLCPEDPNGKYQGHYRLYSYKVEMAEEVPIQGLGAFIGLGKSFGLRVSYKELPDQDISFYGAEFSFSF